MPRNALVGHNVESGPPGAGRFASGERPIPTALSTPQIGFRVTSPWPADTRAAAELQARLADMVVEEGALTGSYLAAGADLHVTRGGDLGVAAVVCVTVPDGDVVEEAVVEHPVTFPYVPGLLSFRELPPLMAAFAALRRRPDVVLVDGHGRAHPRGFGLACHLGLELDLPTVGCAKSPLAGEPGVPGERPGDLADLIVRGSRAGAVLRSRRGCRPLYVSVGHRLSLEGAIAVVEDCLDGHRVPLPLRLAHQLAKGRARR